MVRMVYPASALTLARWLATAWFKSDKISKNYPVALHFVCLVAFWPFSSRFQLIDLMVEILRLYNDKAASTERGWVNKKWITWSLSFQWYCTKLLSLHLFVTCCVQVSVIAEIFVRVKMPYPCVLIGLHHSSRHCAACDVLPTRTFVLAISPCIICMMSCPMSSSSH